jgi:hypothetical protein
MAKAAATLEQRLSKYFQNFVENENGCWVWLGKPDSQGYARVNLFGKWVRVHRLFYERYVGQIKPEEEIHHKCQNRICIRPSHLEAVTRRIHIGRSDSPPGINSRKTHCPRGHPYDRVMADGSRRCSLCDHGRSDYYKKYYRTVRKLKEVRNASAP